MRVLALLAFVLCTTCGVKVGVILSSSDSNTRDAVRSIVQFNQEDQGNDVEIVFQEHSGNFLELQKTLCSMLDDGVVAIVSTSTSSDTALEATVMSEFHIPYIAALATDPYLKTVKRDYLISISPSDKFQSQAIFDLLKRNGWTRFTVMASTDTYGVNGVLHLQDLANRDTQFEIKGVHYFDVSGGPDQLDVSSELDQVKASLSKVIVLNCQGAYAKSILEQAEELGLMGKDFVWIVTEAVAGDPETLAVRSYRRSNYVSYRSYLTGLLGTVPRYGEDTDRLNEFKDRYITENEGSESHLTRGSVMTADAVALVSEALRNYDGELTAPELSCDSTDVWDGGELLLETIRNTTVGGLSGEVALRDDGSPVSTEYDIMNFERKFFKKVGVWDENRLDLQDNMIVYLGGGTKRPTGASGSLLGYHLKVGIVPEPPIAMQVENCTDYTSPICWYGWNPEIILRLASDLNFTYSYHVPEDRKWGGFNPEKREWNGMIKDLLDGKTDMTIALSINGERSRFIDFTLSFYEDTASFIVNTGGSGNSAMFFFLLPFRMGIWASVFVVIALVSFLLCLLSKLSPYGKYGRKIYAQQTCPCQTCVEKRQMKRTLGRSFVEMKEFECRVEEVDDEDTIEDMSFENSFWSVSTGFVQQGGESLPHAPSGRFLLFFWWLFVMILISMYTANLTAFLTLKNSDVDLDSLPDLLEYEDEYNWGIISDRSIESTMKHHKNDKFKEIAQKAKKLINVPDGVSKVDEGNFIFIDDSSVLTYNFKDNCATVQTITDQMSNEWAFGLPRGSPYATLINNQFLDYRERGLFAEMWDAHYTSGVECPVQLEESSRFGLGVVSGLFALFVFGIFLSFLVLLFEVIHVSRMDARKEGKSVCSCFGTRLTLKAREIREEWFGGSGPLDTEL